MTSQKNCNEATDENGSQNKLVYKVLKSEVSNGITIDNNIILYKDDTKIKATYGVCRHHKGPLAICKEDSCSVVCKRHNWKLDLPTMTYTNPTGVKQEELIIRENENFYEVYEPFIDKKWLQKPEKQDIKKSEFTVKFYSHACVEIKAGQTSFFTDPWLSGPCFLSGWWLKYKPPSDWLSKICSSDFIYISHAHSDHLNEETLLKIKNKNPNIKILIPNFESCSVILENIGLHNYEVVEFQKWYKVNSDLKIMLLQDSHREDSGLVVEYKGHRILNTVDCSSNLNDGNYPQVDCLLTSYSTAATGYPTCWPENYGDEDIRKKLKKMHASSKRKVLDHISMSNPNVYVPFAFGTSISNPRDKYIKDRNVSLTSSELCDFLSKKIKIYFFGNLSQEMFMICQLTPLSSLVYVLKITKIIFYIQSFLQTTQNLKS